MVNKHYLFLQRQDEHADVPRPELIILDLNLPKLNRHAVLESIKNDSTLRQIPVLILSTSEAEQDILRAYDLNANCYIKKPEDFDEFLGVVEVIDDFWLSVVNLPSI